MVHAGHERWEKILRVKDASVMESCCGRDSASGRHLSPLSTRRLRSNSFRNASRAQEALELIEAPVLLVALRNVVRWRLGEESTRVLKLSMSFTRTSALGERSAPGSPGTCVGTATTSRSALSQG